MPCWIPRCLRAAPGTKRNGAGNPPLRSLPRKPRSYHPQKITKTRPCLVISPDEMNRQIRTVIVASMTTARRSYPTRVPCEFHGKTGEIVLDQIRTVDKTRLLKKLGRIDTSTRERVFQVLGEMFAP